MNPTHIDTTGCLGQYPLIRDDEEHTLSHECQSEQGGTMTVGVPQYRLIVTNEEQPAD